MMMMIETAPMFGVPPEVEPGAAASNHYACPGVGEGHRPIWQAKVNCCQSANYGGNGSRRLDNVGGRNLLNSEKQLVENCSGHANSESGEHRYADRGDVKSPRA